MELGKVMIGFRITSYNLDKRVCNLTVECNGKKENYRGVKLSALLAWSLENNTEYYNTNVTYTSTMTSESFVENPLQLIRYTDKKTNEVCQMLALVKERTPLKLTYYDPFGNEMTKTINRYHRKEYYLRFRNYVKSNG